MERKKKKMEMVTVLMTTYNENRKIFVNALESILNQTYKNIEILVIVDNKENEEIINTLKEYTEKDDRIAYVVNSHNLGLAESLNKGINLIKTKYIARMDADDISTIDRIEKQVKYAEENPELVLIGSNITYIDFAGNELYKRNAHPNDYANIKEVMKYINIFHHPTFFGKTEIFKKYKYRNLQYSQDYDLVCRLLENNCKVGNMNEYLLYYRKPNDIKEEKLYKQKITYYCIQREYNKGTLNNANINKIVENELNEKNKNNVIKGIKYYNKAVNYYKQKKYLKFIILFIKSWMLSKYQRHQIRGIIRSYKINGGIK